VEIPGKLLGLLLFTAVDQPVGNNDDGSADPTTYRKEMTFAPAKMMTRKAMGADPIRPGGRTRGVE
jgi:hypothetical protein